MSDTASSLDKKVEHHEGRTLASSEVDVAAQLTAGKEINLTPAEAARIRYVLV